MHDAQRWTPTCTVACAVDHHLDDPGRGAPGASYTLTFSVTAELHRTPRGSVTNTANVERPELRSAGRSTGRPVDDDDVPDQHRNHARDRRAGHGAHDGHADARRRQTPTTTPRDRAEHQTGDRLHRCDAGPGVADRPLRPAHRCGSGRARPLAPAPAEPRSQVIGEGEPRQPVSFWVGVIPPKRRWPGPLLRAQRHEHRLTSLRTTGRTARGWSPPLRGCVDAGPSIWGCRIWVCTLRSRGTRSSSIRLHK